MIARIAVVLALFASAATPTATIKTTAIPQTYVGMIVHDPEFQPWPTTAGAIRLWDTGTAWALLNRNPGEYNWTKLDRWIETARRHNVELLYTFGRTPRWASSSPDLGSCAYGPGQCAPPVDMNAWEQFVRAIVVHSAGAIKHWELWNEPNDPQFWTGSPAEMVKMAERAYRIIKQIQPDAVVISPPPAGGGTSGTTWLDSYLAAGGGAYADIIAFHGYWDANPERILSLVSGYKSVASKYGLSDKPLWDTEAGWGKDQALPDNDSRTAFIADYYLLHWSLGVERFYWYAWDNPEWGTLTDKQGLRRAGVAFQQVTHWLIGSTMTSPCAKSSTELWSCSLSRPRNYSALAVWSSKPQRYAPDKRFLTYRDLNGATHRVQGDVEVGSEPILFETSRAQ